MNFANDYLQYILIAFNLLFGSGFLRLVWLRRQQNNDDALSVTLQAAQAQNTDYWDMQKKERDRIEMLEKQMIFFSAYPLKIEALSVQVKSLKGDVAVLHQERQELLLQNSIIKKQHKDEIDQIKRQFEKRISEQQQVINKQQQVIESQVNEIKSLKRALISYTTKITALLPHDNEEANKLVDEINSIFS